MLQRKHRGKIISCYEYGVLSQGQSIVENGEETWVFQAENHENLMMNYSLIQAFNDLLMEGWELVAENKINYILRKSIKRHASSSGV
ncbi:hypothetical protein [Paenibacillus sp. sgz500992]|uniref:hypothetical protein n=1 Tax=Paenibacillus sp. sgz500992 TaxID=3242476 RepID=UPI0036D38040